VKNALRDAGRAAHENIRVVLRPHVRRRLIDIMKVIGACAAVGLIHTLIT
jgi:hypothetical protein